MREAWWGTVVIAVCLSLVAGCGGGSSGSSSGSSGINTLSDVPTNIVDPSAYDLSTSSASSSVSATKAAGDPDSQNTFSRAGCEANRTKKNVIRSALIPKMILCMMQAMETAMAPEKAAGDGVFKYWRAPDGAAGQGPPGIAGEFKPRMAVKKSGDVLTFVMCNGTTKHVEFVLDSANNNYNGHIIGIFTGGAQSFQNQLDFSSDGLPTSAGGGGFTTATFTQSMVENSNFWSGFGSETFEATPTSNVVHGFHNDQGDNNYAGSVYAKFDRTQGTSRFRQDSDGSYPALSVQQNYQNCVAAPPPGGCGDLNRDWLGADGWLKTQCNLDVMAETRICHPSSCNAEEVCCPSVAPGDKCTAPAGGEKTESYTIGHSNPTDPATDVLSFTVAVSSDFAADVAAATLPSSSTAPSIAFTRASTDADCAGSDSWTLMAPTEPPDTTECQRIEAQMSKWDPGDLCLGQQGAAAGGANAVQ